MILVHYHYCHWAFVGSKQTWHLKTDAPDLGRGGFIITDPPEQCPGEFTTLMLEGLGVGSGRYIGVGR